MSFKVPFSYLQEQFASIDDYLADVGALVRSGDFTLGAVVEEFESKFARVAGLSHAVGVGSGTDALALSLHALGIGPGDEVITTPLTFTASVAVIEHVGATPVLADIRPDTLNIDPAEVRAAVTDSTRAIIAVHYGGHPCDLDELQAICDEHDLLLIEDAAHAIPAKYKGRFIGSSDNPVAFSFYATKNLTTAEGGMLTGSPEMIEKGVVASLHGMNRDAWKRHDKTGSWRYDIITPGYKYNMTDLQAGMGLAQLRRLESMQARRREIAGLYTEAFSGLDAFDLPVELEGCESAWHLYPLRLKPGKWSISRDEFIEELRTRNIGTSVHFIAVHTFTYYREKYGYAPGDFPVAFGESERVVTIPLHPGLGEEDVSDVIDSVVDVVRSRT